MGKRRYKRAKRYKRRRKLNSTIWGPILKLSAVIIVIVAVLWAVFYVGIPKLADVVGFEYRAPFAPEATPEPTPRPTPTPHPIKTYDFQGNTHEVVFDGSDRYKWFSDPYFYNDKMIISAGQLDSTGQNVLLSDMFFFNPADRSSEKINLSPENAHFMFPKFNDNWLVYLDSKVEGGGAIMAVDLTAVHLRPVKVKDIYSGQPEPCLWGNYVTFTDRTGTNRDKLFVYDLTTMESTVLAMFNSSVYGQSKPWMHGSTLVWADSATSSGNSDTSVINYIDINSSTIKSSTVGTFVHDPEYNASYTAWLTDTHSRNTQLYAMKGLAGIPELIDSGVVDFGLGSDFIAYSHDQSIYVYMFETKSIYRITADYEYAMFLGVSDNYVIWMDVTSRERDIVKFIKIP